MDIFKKVEKNYKDNFDKLEDKRFHFASRLFLWNDDKFARNKLLELKPEYIGTNEKEYSEKIREILKEDSNNEDILFKNERDEFFIKYPLLKKYNKILFKNLFCETVYGVQLRDTIEKQIKKEDLIKLRDDLWVDKRAIAALSTQAINYFYGLDYYLKEKNTFIDPEYFMDIAEGEDIFNNKNTSVLRVYLLTHCIIGESAFYARYVERNKKSYTKMLLRVESIINEDYENVSLDNKVEFLVCTKLCKKNSYLREKILSDIRKAFDFDRNYFAECGKSKNDAAFKKGEHRNVLALMAFYLNDKLEK